MNWELLADSKLVENLGWTLVSSVWQIGLTWLVLFLILRIFNNISANARYLLAVSALGFAFVLPLASFVRLTNNSAQNRISDKIFAAENLDSLKNQAQPSENSPISVNNKLQTENLRSENAFLSFANLQNYFKENLQSALPMFVLLWIFGVGFFAFRLCGGVWQVHRYKTQGISLPNNDWQKTFTSLRESLRITQAVELLQSSRIETPIVVGWFKPLILVPSGVFLQMNPRELELILAHELIHVRRYDNLFNLAQSFVEILFFYHPCVWWISAVIRHEREFACDDAVTETLENPHIGYAGALANLEEIRRLTKEKMPPVAVAASGGNLMQRINRILEKNTERQKPKQSLWSASLAFLLISAVMFGVFWTGSGFDVNAQGKTRDKKMAIGFVAIPPGYREKADKSFDETARLLIEKLTAHRIPAIGFLNGENVMEGGKLSKNRVDVVRMWRDAGLEVGIGTFKHISFYNTPYDEYINRVMMNEGIAKLILMEKSSSLKFFSYPYLNTGKTAEDQTRFENWLATRGLRPVKYTFDNQEWMYSFAYDTARENNDAEMEQQVKTEFLDYMTKMLVHFEGYSQEMFKRDIAQTMVLTPSRLVVDSADELFGAFEKRGYKFISMSEAQADEAYQTEEKHVDSNSGISWFERWQMAQGKKLRDEPRVSKLVYKTWNEKKSDK